MTKIQKLTLAIIFTFLSITILGCSDGKTTISSSPPTIQISPTSTFNFGTITEGNMASPLEVIITNIGSEELNVSKISISDIGNFKLNSNSGTNYCNTTDQRLFTDESCTIEITFTPEQLNTFSADLATTLEIISNDPNTPNKFLNLAGTSEQVSSKLNVTINQVETATCPNVVAYVSVTDQSNFPVEGLLPANFTVKENGAEVGVPPTGSTVGNVTEPISIAVVMDHSSSMSDSDIIEMNEAASVVIDQLKPTDQAEIIKFDAAILLKQSFTSDKDLLRAAIDTQFFDGSGTALYDTLIVAIDDTATVSGRKAIIVITDGANSGEPIASVSDITDNAQAVSIPIFVIALGNINPGVITDVMEPIANNTSGALYQADVAQNFRTIIEQQLTKVLFTDQYILNYTSGSSGSGTDVNLTIDASNSGGSGTNSKLITSCP